MIKVDLSPHSLLNLSAAAEVQTSTDQSSMILLNIYTETEQKRRLTAEK